MAIVLSIEARATMSGCIEGFLRGGVGGSFRLNEGGVSGT